jgi:type VI secretion system secreted protein VgrG
MHLPRIGQEVIVSFYGGDPDQPIVTGSVFNAMNTPPWSLPEQQALSGFRSRELVPGGGNSAAGRSNHLILDDTEQKIQAQLKSDHAHSQLSLGHITRIANNQGRQDARGQGFELRTDAHGAIRAQDGLLISTEARTAAQAHITDMGETTARLARAKEQHETLGDLAQQHQAQDEQDQEVVSQEIKAQNAAIQGKAAATSEPGSFPELQEPHLVLASPAGIQSTTAGSTHQHSQAHHAITAGQHISHSSGASILSSAAKHIRAFAQQGIRLFAGKGKVQIQANDNSVEIIAHQVIDLLGKEGVHLSSEQYIRLQVGAHMVQMTPAGGIEFMSPQPFVAHTSSMSLTAPANGQVAIPKLPTGDLKQQMIFTLRSHPGAASPMVLEPYTLYKDGAEIAKGVTDENGEVVIPNHQAGTQKYSVKLANGDEYDLPVKDGLESLDDQLAAKGYRAAHGDPAHRLAEYLQDNPDAQTPA